MDILEKIKEAHIKFNEYLMGINIDDLKENYTRQELKEFKSELYDIKIRSLGYEISRLIDEMKLEEFPELLGIHNYPEIKEIEFLTEEEKKSLDDFLVSFRVGNYISGLWRVARDDDSKVERIEKFLLDRGILEEYFMLKCINCYDNNISKLLTKKEKERLIYLLSQENKWEHYDEIEQLMTLYCDECGREYDLEESWDDSFFNGVFDRHLKIIKERDKTLDNV